MNDIPSFNFYHNGVTYTVTFFGVDMEINRIDPTDSHDTLFMNDDFVEANEVIAKIKSKL